MDLPEHKAWYLHETTSSVWFSKLHDSYVVLCVSMEDCSSDEKESSMWGADGT